MRRGFSSSAILAFNVTISAASSATLCDKSLGMGQIGSGFLLPLPTLWMCANTDPLRCSVIMPHSLMLLVACQRYGCSSGQLRSASALASARTAASLCCDVEMEAAGRRAVSSES